MASKNKSELDEQAPPKTFLFARQCDKIGSRGQKTFVYSVAIGLGVFLVWSNLVYLDRITRGEGRVIPATDNQIVQHLEGGIVSQILIKQGASVKKGDILLRIKNSFSHAENSRAKLELIAKRLELQRLDAEANGNKAVSFPASLEKKYPKLIANEKRLFQRRQDQLNEQLLILKDQSNEKTLEFEELRARLKNKVRERELVRKQVKSLTRLVKIGAASTNKLLDKRTAFQRIKTTISDLSLIHI